MECEKFLVEYGLYDKQKIEYEDFTDLINLLSGKVKIDVYCSKCKEKRIFSAVTNKIKLPQENKLVRMNVFWLMETIEVETFEGISEEERLQLFSLLQRVRENLDRATNKGEEE